MYIACAPRHDAEGPESRGTDQEQTIVKIGEKVRHKTRSDIGVGELVEIYPNGTCQVQFPACCFSGIPLEAVVSVEEEMHFAAIAAKAEQERKAANEQAFQLELARKAIQREVASFLDSGNCSEAERLYEKHCGDWWPRTDFDAEKNLAKYIQKFIITYRSGSLSELDSVFLNRPTRIDLSTDDYVELKLPKVRARLVTMGMELDGEQERANCRPETRLLIKARAGAGKTRTLCARAAMAIRDEKLNPNQVLILAFNKAAAVEVKHRIQGMEGVTDYSNARTFHSLAYQLVKPEKKLLFDSGGNPSAREQSRFVQRLMQRIMNPAFKESMVDFFRKELEQIESIGRNLQPEEYFAFRRAMELMSLRGERVKSSGEKFIADFLFEHGIEYRYERAWEWKSDFLGGATYRPDFSIIANGKDYILEHWGIDPEDRNAEVPKHWATSTAEYRRQIDAKRDFWASKQKTLIETHAGLLGFGRESFEKTLCDILVRQGIQCHRLSREEIVKRVFDNDFTISRMADLFLQFIQRAKKKGWSADKVYQIVSSSPDPEHRNRLFHDLALRVYREYEKRLEESGSMDFDDLLEQAVDEVRSKGGEASIHLGEGRHIQVSQIKWILLDEYQDFSALYFRMLDTILQVQPDIRLVAVGDDWQAINAFAGAELGFFENFREYFPGAKSIGVTTNYRSDRQIVAAGNRLMVGRGPPARVTRSGSGQIDIQFLDDIWIEFRAGEQFRAARQRDELYLPLRTDGKNPSPSTLRLAQALKLCASIIVDDPTAKTMLLARTRTVYGQELTGFRTRLIRALSKLTSIAEDTLGTQIAVMTAHGSKGQEASRVIILDATTRQFPKIHPDNLLFAPFGVTPEQVLDEERRLFYVAITRAENNLHIITEKGLESHYLKILGDPFFSEPLADSTLQRKPGEIAKRIQALMDSAGAIEVSEPTATFSETNPWEMVRANVSARFQSLVGALQAANVPLPETEYYLPGDEDGASAELAWPENSPPVAILSAEQVEFTDRWTALGWKVANHTLADDRIIVGVRRYLRNL